MPPETARRPGQGAPARWVAGNATPKTKDSLFSLATQQREGAQQSLVTVGATHETHSRSGESESKEVCDGR